MISLSTLADIGVARRNADSIVLVIICMHIHTCYNGCHLVYLLWTQERLCANDLWGRSHLPSSISTPSRSRSIQSGPPHKNTPAATAAIAPIPAAPSPAFGVGIATPGLPVPDPPAPLVVSSPITLRMILNWSDTCSSLNCFTPVGSASYQSGLLKYVVAASSFVTSAGML